MKMHSLQVHFDANQTHFRTKGFARVLALKQRHKVTRKWPIAKRFSAKNRHQRHLTHNELKKIPWSNTIRPTLLAIHTVSYSQHTQFRWKQLTENTTILV